MTITQPARAAIVTSAYRAAATIQSTLSSVCSQTLRDWEMIVYDAGSDDGTADKAKAVADPRIRVIEGDYCTVGVARNRAVALSAAPLLCFLDADDCWLPHTLERQLTTMRTNPTAGATYGDCLFFRQGSELTMRLSQRVHQPDLPGLDDLVETRPVPISTVAMWRHVFETIGGFDTSLTTCEDYDLWYRITVARAEIRRSPGILARILVRSGGLSDDIETYKQSMSTVFTKLLRSDGLSPTERDLVGHHLEGLQWAQRREFEKELRGEE